MKIATWNIERLKHAAHLNEITEILEDLNADILVLTETDSKIRLPQYSYKVDTPNLVEIDTKNYTQTENRVSIFSHYEMINTFDTFDPYTSLCIELATEKGPLKVYGTIIGIYGNRNKNFNSDLNNQIQDFEMYANEENLCILGDYNISFSDNYYFTKYGRNSLNESFEKLNMELLTRNLKESIDHIAISKSFVKDAKIELIEWNEDKILSDHNGVGAILEA